MDDEQLDRLKDAMLQQRLGNVSITAGALTGGAIMANSRTYRPQVSPQQYSLAEVQLTNGEMIGMVISASPTLGTHLTKEMANTGFLYLFNDTESLALKADRVVAVKLTKMTQE